MVSRSFFGIEPQYKVPAYVEFTHLTQLPWFVFLGLGGGALGAAFLKLLRQSERLFRRLPQPLYARMALGGRAVGDPHVRVDRRCLRSVSRVRGIRSAGFCGHERWVTFRAAEDAAPVVERPWERAPQEPIPKRG